MTLPELPKLNLEPVGDVCRYGMYPGQMFVEMLGEEKFREALEQMVLVGVREMPGYYQFYREGEPIFLSEQEEQ